MSLDEVILEGTIQPDGQLVLNEPTNLPSGRVSVVVRRESSEHPIAQVGWFPALQSIRATREAEGYQFMDAHELDAHLLWLRDDEDRIDRVHREIAEDRRKRSAGR